MPGSIPAKRHSGDKSVRTDRAIYGDRQRIPTMENAVGASNENASSNFFPYNHWWMALAVLLTGAALLVWAIAQDLTGRYEWAGQRMDK